LEFSFQYLPQLLSIFPGFHKFYGDQ
jgi:hypothetical protein